MPPPTPVVPQWTISLPRPSPGASFGGTPFRPRAPQEEPRAMADSKPLDTTDAAFALLDPFDQWWKEVEPEGYYLYEAPLQTAPTTRVSVVDKKTGEVRKDLINFASYNYLGLSYRPEVKEAIKKAVDIYGGGSSGSPILSGTTDLHRQLADAVARFKGKEAASIFPTGYSANVGTIAGLMRSG